MVWIFKVRGQGERRRSTALADGLQDGRGLGATRLLGRRPGCQGPGFYLNLTGQPEVRLLDAEYINVKQKGEMRDASEAAVRCPRASDTFLPK